MASSKAHHATGFAAGIIAAAIVARGGSGPFHPAVLLSFIAGVAGSTAPDWLLGVLLLSVGNFKLYPGAPSDRHRTCDDPLFSRQVRGVNANGCVKDQHGRHANCVR